MSPPLASTSTEAPPPQCPFSQSNPTPPAQASPTPITTTTPSEEPPLLLLTHPSPSIALLRLNRPRKLNALSASLINTLLSTLFTLDSNPSINVIILAGLDRPGGAFCAGADIAEIAELCHEGAYRERYLEDLVEGMRRVRTVIIGAVEGIALGGGCELALMCDILYAAPTATFSQPELTLGTLPGAGGTQRLLKLLGKARTLDLLLTGRALSGVEAAEVGIVARVFPEGEVVERTVEVARGIAERDGGAVRLTKEVVLAGEGLENGLKVERLAYWLSFGMEGKRRGCEAFLERRREREERKKVQVVAQGEEGKE